MAGAVALLCLPPGASADERLLRRLRTVVDAVRIIELADDVAAAASDAGGEENAVVVTDLAGVGSGSEPDQVVQVLAGLQGADAAVIADAVTDAVKQVANGHVIASVERGDLALPRLPVAVRVGALRALRPAGPVPAAAIVPRLVADGRRVRLVRPGAAAPRDTS